MALTRLFVNSDLRVGLTLWLGEEQARYLGKVLRLRRGDDLSVFNGNDGEFTATVDTIGKAEVSVTLTTPVETRVESPLRIHLVQGVSRGERMDFVVQKATELGVKRISPVLTEYGVVKLDATRAGKRRDHWQKVAVSACEQSGRTRPPLIDMPVPLNAWFGGKTSEADVDLVLQPGTTGMLTSIPEPQTKICLLVGPEGGFSATEYDDAALAGFAPVSLGPRILRTETAAIAAIAIAQSLWGDLRLD